MVFPSKWIISEKNIKYEITNTFLVENAFVCINSVILEIDGELVEYKSASCLFLVPFLATKNRRIIGSSDVGWHRIILCLSLVSLEPFELQRFPAHRWIPHRKLHWMHPNSSFLRTNLRLMVKKFNFVPSLVSLEPFELQHFPAHRWIPHQKLHWMHLVSLFFRKSLRLFISFFHFSPRRSFGTSIFWTSNLLTSWKKSLLISKIKNIVRLKKKSIYLTFSFSFFVSVGSLDIGWHRIMDTCAPKFTFIDQKGTDFPNLGTQNSTVTFFSWNKAFKGHKKAKKITIAIVFGHQLSNLGKIFSW